MHALKHGIGKGQMASIQDNFTGLVLGLFEIFGEMLTVGDTSK